MTATIIGIDPGPVVGVLTIRWQPHPPRPIIRAYQVNADSALSLIDLLIEAEFQRGAVRNVVLAHERFIIRPTTARTRAQKAGQTTRDLNGQLAGLDNGANVHVIETRAVDVKRWASNERLVRSGIWAATEGMRHARSAGWHALHCAVHRCGWLDPCQPLPYGWHPARSCPDKTAPSGFPVVTFDMTEIAEVSP